MLIIYILMGCTKPVFKSAWVRETALDIFTTRFETSKGVFDIEVRRNASPKAADRYYQMVKNRFYTIAVFYRVDSNFVVQFGNSDTVTLNNWGKYKVPDEEVIQGNAKGTLSYARAGTETRGSELFINLKDNPKLDTIFYSGVKGFPSFGKVVKGMEVVESIYAGYGDNVFTKLDTLYSNRFYFLHLYPKLDTISKAYILKAK